MGSEVGAAPRGLLPRAGVRPAGAFLVRLRGRPPAGPTLLLAAVATAAVVAMPLGYILVRGAFAGSEAWQRLLGGRLWVLLVNTLALSLLVTGATIVLGVGLAWLTERTDLPGRRVLRWLLCLPLAVPAYLGATIHLALMRDPGGGLTKVLRGFLGDRLPLLPATGLGGAVFVLTLFGYPYVYLLTAAAFRSLPAVYEEVARVFGRGPVAAFVRVTLPVLRPGVMAGAVLVMLDTLAEYGTVSLLRYDTFSSAIFVQLAARYDRGAAAVLSFILVGLALLVLGLERLWQGRGRFAHLGSGWRPALPVRLGRWRAPALGGVSLVVGGSLLVPLGVLVGWTVRAGGGGGGSLAASGFRGLGGYLTNSLWSAGLAALLAVAFSVPVAVFAVRHGGLLARLCSRLAQVGYAVPGVVVALSVLLLVNRSLTFLYATPLVVVLAYVVRHLPQAVRASESAVGRVGPEVEEAARSLGRGPFRAFSAATFRLALPGVLAGGALVFLTSLKELPATLLLRPAGFDTLAVRVWTWAGDGYYPQAAPAALLLVALAGAPLLLFLRSRRASL